MNAIEPVSDSSHLCIRHIMGTAAVRRPRTGGTGGTGGTDRRWSGGSG